MFWKIPTLLILLAFFGAVECEEADEKKLDWWQTAVIYQLYPKSFEDSNGDGVGDLEGIISKLSYLKDLKIDALWLSPIFRSPYGDSGYDISNFTDIDPVFGTMDDFISVINKSHSLGIKVLLEIVPNHTSDEHPWFKKSMDRIDPYTDYYVWKDPRGWIDENTPIPPNNWASKMGGSAWTFNSPRGQFYYHYYLPQEPDLNYRSKNVIEEMKDVLRFYLNLGIDGFQLHSVSSLVEDDRFLNEPLVNRTSGAKTESDYSNLKHIYTINEPETYKILGEFRSVLDSYKKRDGTTRLLLAEAYTDVKDTVEYYGTVNNPFAQLPVNPLIRTELNDTSSAVDFEKTINKWLHNVPEGEWPNWQIGNADSPRIPTRFEPSAVDMMNMLVLLLPGTAFTYQGEEIGMEDSKLRPDQIQDRVMPSADPERTPFQWDSSLNAGFSRNKTGTWLPVNPDFYELNLVQQEKDPRSHYNIYKTLVNLRSKPAFQKGDYDSCILSKYVFSFRRTLGEEMYIILMNLDDEESYVNFTTCDWNLSKGIRPSSLDTLEVVVPSANSNYEIGQTISTNEFALRPKAALVLAVYQGPKASRS